MLAFDAETTRLLETAYRGAELTRRRQASFDALDPQPGERIADIGCGNGMLTKELALAVGPQGRVVGIDPSDAMRAAAERHCSDDRNVEFRAASAEALPLADEAMDGAAALQVFEYIPDVEPALAEAFRILRPGGRLVIADLHLGSFLWRSDDPARMARMMEAWEAHFASGDLPERLPGLIRDLGHEVLRVLPHTMVATVLKPDGLAMVMLHLMRSFAVGEGLVATAEADAWFAEQEALSREGRFFFSMTQYVTLARKN